MPVLFHIIATNVCHSCKGPVNSPAFHVTNTRDAGYGRIFGNTPNSATSNRNTNKCCPPDVTHYLMSQNRIRQNLLEVWAAPSRTLFQPGHPVASVIRSYDVLPDQHPIPFSQTSFFGVIRRLKVADMSELRKLVMILGPHCRKIYSRSSVAN